MASAASALLLQPPHTGSDKTQKIIRAYFKVTVTVGNYTTGGIPLSLAPVVQGLPVSIKGLIFVHVESQQPAATVNTKAFYYQFCKGTTIANGTLQVYGQTTSAGLTELTGGGATPSGVTGDIILGWADFEQGT